MVDLREVADCPGVGTTYRWIIRRSTTGAGHPIGPWKLIKWKLIRASVTTNPTAQWIAGQVTEAFPWNEAPPPLTRDRDRSFGPAYTHRIRAMGIRDHPAAPRSPWQNRYLERLIGSIRRECLDHMVVVGEADLRRVLKAYASYYNRVRTHLSLSKDAPLFRRSQTVGDIAAIPILGGLHHLYVRV